MRQKHYEDDVALSGAYQVQGYRGVAWRILGWETEPDSDTEWSGQENRTGQVVAVMVGDDRYFTFDLDLLTPISEEAYCGSCGQIGCCH